MAQPTQVDYYLYTAQGEEWRAEAYFLLKKIFHFQGWNDLLERMEGTLLGYTDEENDIHIALRNTRRST